MFKKARFEFAVSTISAFGGALIIYLYEVAGLSAWVSGLALFVWLMTLFAMFFLHAEKEGEKEKADRLEREKEGLTAKLSEERRVEAINLQTRVIEAVARSLRAITEGLKEAAAEQRSRSHEGSYEHGRRAPLKRQLLVHVCQELRSVFEGDTRGVDRTTWPHNFFKIAIYEVSPRPDQAKELRRIYADYPGGLQPSGKTEVFDLQNDARAAAVLAFREQGIIVLEDIRTENQKPPEVKRWINKRENQADEYASMVCAAIVSGRRGEPGRQCLGVLVIDTNRERYFREERSFEAFLGSLLSPFRTILSFILSLEEILG